MLIAAWMKVRKGRQSQVGRVEEKVRQAQPRQQVRLMDVWQLSEHECE